MAVTPSQKESREVIVTRFVLFYILAILFALVPMIFLFSVTGKAIRELKVSNLSQKGQKNQIDRFQEIYMGLEKLLVKENYVESDFGSGLITLTNFIKDSIESGNMYKPVYTDVKLLFDHIQKANKENPDRVNYDVMKQLKEQCERDLKVWQEKFNAEHEAYIKLQIKSGL
jgi:hypothetical protein